MNKNTYSSNPPQLIQVESSARRGINPTITSMVLSVLVILLASGYWISRQQVTVYAAGEEISLHTHQSTVASLLESMNIELLPGDQVTPALSRKLHDGMEIEVDEAETVEATIDGREISLRTQAATVGDLFSELAVNLEPGDILIQDGIGKQVANPHSALQDPLPARVEVIRSVPIVVNDNGVQLAIRTSESTVDRALYNAGLVVYLGDDVRPSLHSEVVPGMEITIHRSLPVTIVVDGHSIKTRTHRATVGDLLAELGVTLVGFDYSIPGVDDSLESNANVEVVRVRQEILTEQEPIPYDHAWQPDPNLEIDLRRIVQTGEPGVLQRRIVVRYENGEEVSRVLEDEWIALDPKTHITGYGTMIVPRIVETEQGPMEYWRKLRVLATSYTAADCDKTPDHPAYGITAVGWQMRFGIIAVDPRYINLFQDLYVPGYGVGVAGDTGGAIKGMRIDLGYEEGALTLWYNWVDVYLLMPPPDPSEIRYVIDI